MNLTARSNSLSFANDLKALAVSVEEELKQLVPTLPVAYSSLHEAAKYSLLNGGKRIRPIMAMLVAESLGCPLEQTIKATCALELIHTYSLIHDDLPCMDDDDFRRGKPSLHKAFSEGLAVLTGDYLLTLAFEILATNMYLDNAQKVELIRILSLCSGAPGMIGGQVMDIESEGHSLSLEELIAIHQRKTGALFTAAIQFGAIIGKATPSQTHHLEQFSKDIGLAFQIVDDVLDVSENLKHSSYTSSDIKNNKCTYTSLLGIDQARSAADQLYESALTHLSQLSFPTQRLRQLAKMMVYRRC